MNGTSCYQPTPTKTTKVVSPRISVMALQSRIIAFLTLPDQRPFWTPHSGRHFMPSASAALGHSLSDREPLGGWGAEGSRGQSAVRPGGQVSERLDAKGS